MLKALTIHDLDINNKPRERLTNLGAGALTDAELLAIILRSGGKNNSVINLALYLLSVYKGFGGLFCANFDELSAIKDLGIAKATSIKALAEIALRFNVEIVPARPKLVVPEDVYILMRKHLFGKQREHLYVISVDARRNVLSKDLISVGTVNETLVHPREVFKTALFKNATSIILVHNHPTNNTSPSDADIQVTHKIAQAGKTLGIGLLDHVILGNNNYSSLKLLGHLDSNNFYERG